MDLPAFRELCANGNTKDEDIVATIMAEKRTATITAEEKDQICSILRETNHAELAEKFCRNRARYRSRAH